MKADDTKSETLQFKVTEQERKLIERCAEEEATTVSKYVRGAVLMSMVMDGKAEAIKIVAREGLWRGPTEACQTGTGRTLRTVLSVTPLGDKAGPRRMPGGCGAERNGPRPGNTGALPTALRTGVR